MKSTVLRLESLSDDQLLARVVDLVGRARRAEAELIWHLAEVDRRKLYRREACRSMHVYATSRLHLSDAEAFLRITVARVSRRYPSVLSMLADGRVHLTAVALLAPHLDDRGGEALLERAVHKSKREVELLVAEIAPRPDVPSGMRRLPAPALRPDGAIAPGDPTTAPPAPRAEGGEGSLAGAEIPAEEGAPQGARRRRRRDRRPSWPRRRADVSGCSSPLDRSSTTRSGARRRSCVIRSRTVISPWCSIAR